jgi:hypothetical protein
MQTSPSGQSESEQQAEHAPLQQAELEQVVTPAVHASPVVKVKLLLISLLSVFS